MARSLIEHADATDPVDWPLRAVLYVRDQLRTALAAEGHDALVAWQPAPRSTGSQQWDTLLAAVIRHEIAEADIEPPGWTVRPPIAEDWVPQHPIWTPEQARKQTPDWLAAVGIYMPARDLQTQ